MRKLNSLQVLLFGGVIVAISMYMAWNLPWPEVKIKAIPVTILGTLVMIRAIWLAGKDR